MDVECTIWLSNNSFSLLEESKWVLCWTILHNMLLNESYPEEWWNCDGGDEENYELLEDYLLMQPIMENNARGEQLLELIVVEWCHMSQGCCRFQLTWNTIKHWIAAATTALPYHGFPAATVTAATTAHHGHILPHLVFPFLIVDACNLFFKSLHFSSPLHISFSCQVQNFCFQFL